MPFQSNSLLSLGGEEGEEEFLKEQQARLEQERQAIMANKNIISEVSVVNEFAISRDTITASVNRIVLAVNYIPIKARLPDLNDREYICFS